MKAWSAAAGLRRIRGVTWTWKSTPARVGKRPGSLDAGVIAPDVEAVLPELVVTIDGIKRVSRASHALGGSMFKPRHELCRNRPGGRDGNGEPVARPRHTVIGILWCVGSARPAARAAATTSSPCA
jgi:hypothetical protein